jgi:flagellar biosynthetic protein FliO
VSRVITKKSGIVVAAGAVAAIIALGSLMGAAAPGSGTSPSPSTWLHDPNGLLSQNTGVTRELIVKTIGSLVLVIGLGLVAAYVLRRIGPRLCQIPGKQIRVVETTALGPKKALHVVEVGPQRFLIGSTPDQVTMLAVLSQSGPQAGSADPGKGL